MRGPTARLKVAHTAEPDRAALTAARSLLRRARGDGGRFAAWRATATGR